MRYILLFAFLFMGNQSLVYSQNTLSGKITNEKKQPLAGSHIHVSSFFANADETGNYTINGIPNARLQVFVEYLGYKTLDTILDFQGNKVLNIALKPDVSQLSEVVLKETYAKEKAQEIKTSTIEKYSSESLGDALKEISGVSSLKTGNTIVKPIINGLHSSRVLIINNNVRLEDQQWGTEHAPNMDLNTAGKISVIKGAQGLQFGGDAIGGTVIIDPPHIPIKDTIFGKTILSAQSNGRGGSLTSSLFKGYKSGWNWNLQGTYKYLGDFKAPDYVLSNTGNREKNFSGSLGYKGENQGFSFFYSYFNAEIGILRASHISAVSDLIRAINSGQPQYISDFSYDINAPRQELQHHLGKINYYKLFSNDRKLSLQYSFQFNNRLEFDLRRGADRDKPSLDLDLKTHTFNADFEGNYSDNLKYKVGISAGFQNNFADTDNTNVRALIPNYDKSDAGIYAIGTYILNNKLSLEAGLRYDFSHIDAQKYYLKTRWTERGYDTEFSDFIVSDAGQQWYTNPVFDYNNFSGSLGSKYEFSNNLHWTTNVGVTSRNPNPAELFSDGLHHATGQIELGDLALKREVALKLSTAFNYTSSNFALEINPYANFINDFKILIPTTIILSNRGPFPVWEYKQVNARLFGVDFTADYDFAKNLNWHSTAAFVYGDDLTNDTALIDMPPMNFNNSISFRKTSWNNLVLSLKNETVLTQKRYPNNDFYIDVLDTGEPVSTLVEISKPPKGYSLLHFNSEMSFSVLNNSKMTIGFNIQNIMNTNYRDYLNRIRYYADDLGRNFRVQLKLNY
ncbi:TonB-dependent receptor [uncultured Flavobacterium sp.]|uniref:TonB-dependent receptor n=1 Tax=uncultured Flavobacterium sp. TaxID=165435 RepID=UPI0025D12C99|nr:TonB-dependent receptor [uncultured Flavobacterium sp.]